MSDTDPIEISKQTSSCITSVGLGLPQNHETSPADALFKKLTVFPKIPSGKLTVC